MKIYIIVLHFGNSKVTEKCLKSITQHEKNYEEIVIVNNDSSKFKIQNSKFNSKLKIIDNKENLGYAGGMNVGIKYAIFKNATHILLLNNDTLIKEKIIDKLSSFLIKEKNAGITAPAIEFIRNEKTIYDLGGRLNLLFGRTSHIEAERIENKKEKLVDYASGCSMMVKRQVFEKIGYFDEKFFLYYEDVDFCQRAKKKGLLTYVLPEISIKHILSSSVGKDSETAIENQLKSAVYFGRKNIKNRFFNIIFIIYQSFIFLLKNPKQSLTILQTMISL